MSDFHETDTGTAKPEQYKMNNAGANPDMSFMKNEWNLSDKIEWKPIRYAIPTEDIQEFIRRDTELIMDYIHNRITGRELLEKRKELAGSRLVEDKNA